MATKTVHKLRKVSQLFPPVRQLPSSTNVHSKSYKHFVESGIVAPISPGLYAWLPAGYRAIEKLKNLIQNEMNNIGAQQILLPSLTESALWQKTNRLEHSKTELFMLQDRHSKEYILSPTYEEQICKMMSSIGMINAKILPIRLYQISSKWRDERRPKCGFIRSREFLMKDLYTFDANLEDAKKTYNIVCEAYDIIFKKIGIHTHKVIADNGLIGGNLSHEFHYETSFGDDNILFCSTCQYAINKNIAESEHCPECKSQLSETTGIEVGHTFLLDTTYSKPLGVLLTDKMEKKPAVMGCYGMGVDRILTAAVEILSTNTELRWPMHLAPYTVCVIQPKKGSREECANQYMPKIAEILSNLNIESALDDRTELTVGQRLITARRVGYPYAIVINKAALEDIPLFEIHDIYKGQRIDLPLEAVKSFFEEVAKRLDENAVTHISTDEPSADQLEELAYFKT